MKIRYKLSIVMLLLIGIASCGKEENKLTHDVFFEKYYHDNIFPSLDNFKSAAEKQVELITKFNNNRTDENFNNLQQQWFNCASLYSKARVYNFKEINKQFFDIKIYNFPANVSSIEDNIDEDVIYNSTYLDRKSSTTKGLATVEYLLFDDGSKTRLERNTQRYHYLLAIAQEILNEANDLIQFWQEDYLNVFINSGGKSCIKNARCLAFNQIINILDVARVTKLEKPAGINGSKGTSISDLEAFRSKKSLDLIVAQLNEVESVYSKSSTNFASIVNAIDEEQQLTKAINAAFNELYLEIDKLESSLSEAIKVNDPQINKIYDSLSELIRLFSVDGASLLSVATLPTDNDGD
ncbi:imelysin family protein [Wenyingzhuangia sp. IMCC45533]